jgi:hypothetical protein
MFAFASGFSFDGYSSAATLESDLSDASSLVHSVRLQNYRASDDSIDTMALVALQHGGNTSVVALSEDACEGAPASGCFAGYTITGAAINIDTDDLSATLWAWEEGTFAEVGSMAVEPADDGLELTAVFNDAAFTGLLSLIDDESNEPLEDGGMTIAVAFTVGVLASLAATAIYNWATGDGTSEGEDYDGDGTSNQNDADDDGDGRLDDDDDYPWDPEYSISRPVDVNLLFDASELIERDQVQLLAH